MGDALVARYWCHMCSQMVSPVMEVEIKCPFCESGFVEEMDGGRADHHTDLGSDRERALSLWAPILLGMMGGGGGGGGGAAHRRTRRLLQRRELESEEDDNDNDEEEEENRERDLEAIIRRRRRRSSTAVLHLLQGLRAGLVAEQENSENERERGQQQLREQERVILVNPFNQAIILEGSFDVNRNQNQNQTAPGSLGDYLIGPGLDLLLQHLVENDPNRHGSPPAKKEAVEAMPTVKIEENLQCSVCLDDFEFGAEAKEMPCKHKFHAGCILPWLQLHSSCPVCRFEMPAVEEGAAAKVDGDGGGSRSGSNRVERNNTDDGEDGNGRRTWLSIPWPFNGLFSLSGTQSGGGGINTSTPQPSPPQSSSSSSMDSISSSSSISTPKFRCFDPSYSNHISNPISSRSRNFSGSSLASSKPSVIRTSRSLMDLSSEKDQRKIVPGDAGYVLEDVPHLTDYIPDLPTYPNPLQDNPSYSVVKQYFVNMDDTVAQKIVVHKSSPRGTHFRRAGPRQKVYFDSDAVHACIVTCGGLCPGLNTVIREIICGLNHMYGVKQVLGIEGGYKGFYARNTIPLTPKVVNDIHKRGGTILGTSRGGHDTSKIVDSIQDRGINQVYIIGGDGTQRGAAVIYEEIKRRGLKVAVAGIPKTIDNDIPVIDKSFGFDTAVEEAQRAINAAHVEAESVENGVGVVKLMGRFSGFIAMYATLASRDVDCCLIPESPFYLEGEGGLFEYMEKRLKENGHMVIVIAEGAGQELLSESLRSMDQQDASGNKQLQDVGLWISQRIREYFAKKQRMVINLKYIDPTYMIRAIPSNASDNVYCTLLAHSAIHGAMAGYTGFTVGPVNGRHAYIPFYRVIETQNYVCITDRMWARLLSSTNQPSFLSVKEIMEGRRNGDSPVTLFGEENGADGEVSTQTQGEKEV